MFPEMTRTVSMTRSDMEKLAETFVGWGINLGRGLIDLEVVRSGVHTLLDETWGKEIPQVPTQSADTSIENREPT